MCKRHHQTLLGLKKKAEQSDCTYRVAAIAFDKKGDVLGYARNNHAVWNVLANNHVGRAGTARHAERILMSRYGENIKSILICRVGHGGDLRPIDACSACKKVADKLGIKITSVKNSS